MMCTFNKIKFFFTICITVLTFSSYSQKVFRVTLDAGHGGGDGGAMSGKYIEKDIALAIVLKIGAILESQKYVHVDYTRKTDVFIDLVERGLIANKNKASVFVSIHCNANKKSEPYGTETYVMGLSKKDVNLSVVKKENEAYMNDANKRANVDKFKSELSNDNGIEAKILQEAHMAGSIELATNVEAAFEKAGRYVRGEKGVKPAPFMVLHKAIMPRVLIETGFITNPNEGAYLYSETGQNEIARAVANSILNFKTEFFGTDAEIEADNNRRSLPKDFSIPPPTKEILASTNIKTPPKKEMEDVVIAPKPVLSPTVSIEVPKTEAIEPANVKTSNFISKIQFFASSKKHDLNSSKFNGFEGITEEIDGSLFKYSCGFNTNLDNLKESYNTLNYVRRQGFPSAFLVVHKDGKRLSDNEIEEIMYTQLISEGKKTTTRNKNTENDVIESNNNLIESLKTDFKIQLMATKTYVDNLEFNSRGLKDIEVSFENGFYKYLYGLTSDYNTSLVFLEEAKSKGYPEAFLIAFKAGRKLSLDELKTLTIQEENK